MYAVIRTGGKQYQVAPGQRCRVEKLAVVEGAKVTAKIVEQGKDKKIVVFKKKRRKGYRLKQGHRQQYTALEIQEISA
jgi:large subunit ribosomal protein L21